MIVAADAAGSCDSASSACGLEAAVVHATNQTGRVVELTLEAGEYELDTPLRFGDSSGAAEVVVRAAAGAEVVLRPSAQRRRLQGGGGSGALLDMRAGMLTLERVRVRDASGAPAVFVLGGRLRLRKCALSNNAAGALHVSGGEVIMEDGIVADNGGEGAVVVSGGMFAASSSTFTRNAAATSGGAALRVTAGTVVLGNGTLMLERRGAAADAAMQLDGGSVRYELPAPLGRWVIATNGVAVLLAGRYDGDYPYECVPGVYGDSLEQNAQSGPGCAAPCPAGYYCPRRSVNATTCPPGAYCPLGSGAYLACPSDKTTILGGKTSAADCICDVDYYGRERGGELVCEACPVGTNCALPGATLEHLPLGEGHWRANANTTDVRLCLGSIDGSSCVGCLGADSCGGPNFTGCKPGTGGPYCRLCVTANQSMSMYFDSDEMACLPCHSGHRITPLAVAGGVVLVACVLYVCRSVRKRRPTQQDQRKRDQTRRAKALRRLRRILKSIQRKLTTKIKTLVSFYQIITKVGETYAVTYPPSVEKTLDVFAFTNLELDGLGLPLACLSLGSFEAKLIFLMLLPFGLMIVFGSAVGCRRCVARWRVAEENRRSAIRGSEGGMVDLDTVATLIPDLELLQAAFDTSLLPMALRISFLAFPTVSSLAFKAFRCDDLDANDGLPGPAVLQADLAVECWDEHGDTTDEYRRIRRIASVSIALYPVGVPLFYMALFFKARRAIWANQPTSLSTSLEFLIGDYDAAYFFWELVEVLKKLLLVGAMSVVMPGELNQLIIAFVISLCFLVALLIAKPFKKHVDDVIALSAGFALVMFFFFSIMLKVQTLTEAVGDSLTGQLARNFSINAGTIAALLILSTLGALMLVSAMIIVETAAESFKDASAAPDATPPGVPNVSNGVADDSRAVSPPAIGDQANTRRVMRGPQGWQRSPIRLPQPSAVDAGACDSSQEGQPRGGEGASGRHVRDSINEAEMELREITHEDHHGTREHPGREVRRGSLIRLNAAARAALATRPRGRAGTASEGRVVASDAAPPIEIPGPLEA